MTVMLRIIICSYAMGIVAIAGKTFEAKELSETTNISVTVHSFIPAHIHWTTTNQTTFSITIHDENSGTIDAGVIDLRFLSNTSHVILVVTDALNQQVALISGTGRRVVLDASQIFVVLWFSAMIGNWRHIFIVTVIVIVSLVAHVFAETLVHMGYNGKRKLAIDIWAPKRLHYQNISLVSRNGSILYDGIVSERNVECSTESAKAKQYDCSMCCYGRGLCYNNTCFCDDSYDSATNCQLRERRDVVYSHPLDPRLLRTQLPNGDEVFMYYVLDTNTGTMKTKTVVKTANDLKSFLVEFDQYGHIKRIIQNADNDKSYLLILVSRGCLVRVCRKLPRGKKKVLKRVNMCNSMDKRNTKHKGILTDFGKLESNVQKLQRLYGVNTRSTNHSLLADTDIEDTSIAVSMKVKSCGVEKIKGDASLTIQTIKVTEIRAERVSLPVFKRSDGSFYFSLPNITSRHNEQRIDEKCSVVYSIGRDMCISSILKDKTNICRDLGRDEFSSASDLKQYDSNNLTRTCLSSIQSLVEFCKPFPLESVAARPNCSALFNDTRNMFETDRLVLTPVVTLADGKIINGLQNQISLQNLSLMGPPDIIIEDDKPTFKINSITVIPTDPLPLDLYQVRLDYSCATNYTVIDMRITGSDLYTNYAVCSGINPCSCCVLHAAGASGSVVDNVVINVTDPWTGTSLVKEVVVIF